MKFWLPEPGDVRTTKKIKIPYNPLILQKKTKTPIQSGKPAVNILHKAEAYSKLLEQGMVNSKAELAKREGLTRARVTQILNLLKLAPEIQEFLGSLTDPILIKFFTERRLRRIAAIKDHETQLERFQELKRQVNIQEKSQTVLA